mmetsp:Transcript_10408/g.23748  ORF Transcript_10408/g.23748 Transcript_10408/m.23748 type:complete len:811 (+) Transcript_10408:69-2501(+)
MGGVIGLRAISNSEFAVVEKKFGGEGVRTGLIANEGEVGFQPRILRGGYHFYRPIMFDVHKSPLISIMQGKIGYVFARDGKQMQSSQTLASNRTAKNYDATSFLRDGGERGPQRMILREGTYAFNLAIFIVVTEEQVYALETDPEDEATIEEMANTIRARDGFTPIVIDGAGDNCGIVTVHDGQSLPQGQLLAPIVGDDPRDEETYHHNFQDADKFIAANGNRGVQLQVISEGTYYINRLFATVNIIPKFVIPVGWVGVVVSFTGAVAKDVSGESFRHGELVPVGCKGVWDRPMLPGKYARNPSSGDIIMVPTTNVILSWQAGLVGEEKLDDCLREVSLVTKDGFGPLLPLSVVVNIDWRRAPRLVQRFGDVKSLIENTLDPLVSSYFRDVGQDYLLVDLLQRRAHIQERALEEMGRRFDAYDVHVSEVLLGSPHSEEGDTAIEEMLEQLRTRQISHEQGLTYDVQQRAATKERQLREVQAKAKQQYGVTASEISIHVQTNHGKADYLRAKQKAAEIRELSAAEAESTIAMGKAEAMVLDEKVRAYGAAEHQVMQQTLCRYAEAVETGETRLVPPVVMAGVGIQDLPRQALLAVALADKVDSGWDAGLRDAEWNTTVRGGQCKIEEVPVEPVQPRRKSSTSNKTGTSGKPATQPSAEGAAAAKPRAATSSKPSAPAKTNVPPPPAKTKVPPPPLAKSTAPPPPPPAKATPKLPAKDRKPLPPVPGPGGAAAQQAEPAGGAGEGKRTKRLAIKGALAGALAEARPGTLPSSGPAAVEEGGGGALDVSPQRRRRKTPERRRKRSQEWAEHSD